MTGILQGTLESHTDRTLAAIVSSDSQLPASGSNDQTIRQSGTQPMDCYAARLRATWKKIAVVTFYQRQLIFSGQVGGSIIMFVRRERCEAPLETHTGFQHTPVAFSGDIQNSSVCILGWNSIYDWLRDRDIATKNPVQQDSQFLKDIQIISYHVIIARFKSQTRDKFLRFSYSLL